MHAVKENELSKSDRNPANDAGNLLGRLLVDQGKIENRDISRIVKHARKRNLRFGEAAKDLRLISKTDLEHAMAEQFDYPYLQKGEGGLPKELVAAFKPFSAKGQALRTLRARLLQQWGNNSPHQTLAIAGSSEGEGCSYIAANLAIVFSQLGQRTLLVDSDMINSRQHSLFRVKNNVGLSAALMGRTNIGQVIKRLTLFRNLYILPAGASPPNVAELLGRREMARLIEQLRDHFDVVIFDTPPASANCGAEVVASACGDALIVVRKNKTRVAEAEELVDSIRALGGNVIGSVINKF